MFCNIESLIICFHIKRLDKFGSENPPYDRTHSEMKGFLILEQQLIITMNELMRTKVRQQHSKWLQGPSYP